jgi:hypothetical protein
MMQYNSKCGFIFIQGQQTCFYHWDKYINVNYIFRDYLTNVTLKN